MSKKKSYLSFLLSFIMILGTLGSLNFIYAQESNNLIKSSTQEKTTGGAVISNPYYYQGEGYSVEFKVINQWEGQFNGEFVITNTGNEILKNWQLVFDFQHEIMSLWNAEIVGGEDRQIRIKHQDYNKNIAVGESISVGFIASWQDRISAPNSYKLFMNISKPSVVEGCDIELNITNNWQQAFTGEIGITNNTSESINEWSLAFDFERNIQQFWNANLVSKSGKHYVVEALEYNKEILPGATVYIGFMADPGDGDIEIEDYKLSQKKQVTTFELSIPTNLSIKKQENLLCLTWDSVENASTYEVEVDGEIIAEVNKAIYTYTPNKVNHQYIYRIRAKNSEVASKWSESEKYINWQEGVPVIIVTTEKDIEQEETIVAIEANNVMDYYTVLMTIAFESNEMEIIEESLKTQLGIKDRKVYLAQQIKKNDGITEVKVLVSLTGKQNGISGLIQVLELRGREKIESKGEIKLKDVQVINSKLENMILTGIVDKV